MTPVTRPENHRPKARGKVRPGNSTSPPAATYERLHEKMARVAHCGNRHASGGRGGTDTRSAGIVSRPPGYTVLAFTWPDKLPLKVTSRTKFSVSFMVRNVTGADHDYRWALLLAYNGRRRQQSGGQLSLAAGRAATLSSTVTMACSGGTARVVISLSSPVESIDFQTECLPHAGRVP